MRPFSRKSHARRMLEKLTDSADLPNGVKSGLSGKPGRAGLITAGGLAGLTAASAGISARRRRGEEET